MPTWLPENNTPSPSDTEVRSLWKISSLCQQWSATAGVTPTLPWLGGVLPKPSDTEVPLLQKINACLYAIAKSQ